MVLHEWKWEKGVEGIFKVIMSGKKDLLEISVFANGKYFFYNRTFFLYRFFPSEQLYYKCSL